MSRLTPLRKIDPPSLELRQTDYKDTEVTEALGGLASHTASLQNPIQSWRVWAQTQAGVLVTT